MNHTPYAQPAAPVLHTPDGTPYYAAPPQTAPLALYQPVTHHPVPLPQHPAAAYLPAQSEAAGRDPWPARLLAGGIGVGAGGLGLGFLLQTLAAATTGLGFLLGILAVVWLLKNGGTGAGGGRGGAVNVHVNVSNRNR
ncbi:hypothetical protein ACFV1L_25610 [Kitasatospora sp. NPDC059646]|uniref:hypothetical protein n=1 Tax=Kitasatospora sp. NPDC059646 TaxID=3346893 RepID=UPI0036B6B1DF